MKIKMWVEANATETVEIPDQDVENATEKEIADQCWAYVNHFVDQNTHSGYTIVKEEKSE